MMIKVFLLCPTLGKINRGIESFTRECFEALLKVNSLDVTLFKGCGNSTSKDITLGTLHRDSSVAVFMANSLNLINKKLNPQLVEHGSFFLSLLPYIYLKKPDVIYFSHYALGNLLWHWQRRTKQSYKLLFRNGGPTGGEALKTLKFRFDRIQQLAPIHYKEALDVGIPDEKQSLIPNAINMSRTLQLLSLPDKKVLRRNLGLPEECSLVISVGALNKSHKRMDYIIRELFALPEPRPYLLLIGQTQEETPEIFKLGNDLLGSKNFKTINVKKENMEKYYKVADIFILASLKEGLPRVCLEAMSHGLPCLVHDYETTRFILGKEGYFTDLKLEGSLSNLLFRVLGEANILSKRKLYHQTVYDRFSWNKLLPDYVRLIEQCANS
ncbi:MAG: glycosyltransferase family 4 protein [Cyanobacteriota bacterium]|nr:glycosyltransferase family 4 protein [Cyanobacteriota bacterium]